MKSFCFSIDDNVRFFKELCQSEASSFFHHPYTALLKRLHERYGLKIQLNTFYRSEGFDLSLVGQRFYPELSASSDWLKFSFHSEYENVDPYIRSSYEEVYENCARHKNQLAAICSEAGLAKTTTLHYCQATKEGVKALADNGYIGLIGLFGTDAEPRSSYSLDSSDAARIRGGEILEKDGVCFASIDLVINTCRIEELAPRLTALLDRESVRVMIHEQYFYEDYRAYQPDFEEKLDTVFRFLASAEYKSIFFEELLDRKKASPIA